MIDVYYNESINDLQFLELDSVKMSNLLTTQKDTLIYAKDFGIDLYFWMQPDIAFQTGAFIEYVTNQAFANNIVVDSFLIESVDFELVVNLKLRSENPITITLEA